MIEIHHLLKYWWKKIYLTRIWSDLGFLRSKSFYETEKCEWLCEGCGCTTLKVLPLVSKPLEKSWSSLNRMTRTASRNRCLQPHSSSPTASKTSQNKSPPSWNTSVTLKLLSGSLSISCTVGGKSPYVPWENCAWVTHNTIMIDMHFFFMKCWETRKVNLLNHCFCFFVCFWVFVCFVKITEKINLAVALLYCFFRNSL